MPACTVAAKSRSGSASIRSASPSASEKSVSATASGSACRHRIPSRWPTASIAATCRRVARMSSAYSAAMSLLRRESVNSSKSSVTKSGSSRTVSWRFCAIRSMKSSALAAWETWSRRISMRSWQSWRTASSSSRSLVPK